MSIRGLKEWVQRLSANEVPVLSKVIRELNQLTGKQDTEIGELANVILRDPHLTSQVLRIANSVRYNPGEQEINTVTRAIVLVGFNGVRAICVSLMVVESLIGKKPTQQLLQQMAFAFHGATQAKAIAASLPHDEREEVFVAALLFNLGEMAFWAYGGKTADQINNDLNDGIVDNPQALIEAQLGTTFKDISRELGRIWKLGRTLQEALSKKADVSMKAKAVRIGESIGRLQTDDWQSAEMIALRQKVVNYTGLSPKDAQALINKSAGEAASVALHYGAPQVCQLIPNPLSHNILEDDEIDNIIVLEPNAKLQLKLLRELSAVVVEQVDVNTVFRMVLEGMHRGIGLERVALALFKKDSLIAKYIHGQGTSTWREDFAFDLTGPSETIFSYANNQKEPVWLGEQNTLWDKPLFTEEVVKVMTRQPLLMGVLRINNRRAGLFYADRGKTGEALTSEHFDAFCHFIMQAQMSLQAMVNRQ